MSVVCWFMHSPKEPLLQATHRILLYSKSSLGKRILFKKNKELSLEVYIDVDWA